MKGRILHMGKTKGRVTLPSETNFLKETQEIMDRWGADAIRDSDGTKLSDDIIRNRYHQIITIIPRTGGK